MKDVQGRDVRARDYCDSLGQGIAYDVTFEGVIIHGCSECGSDNWSALLVEHLIEVDALLSHAILGWWCGGEAAKHALGDDKDQ